MKSVSLVLVLSLAATSYLPALAQQQSPASSNQGLQPNFSNALVMAGVDSRVTTVQVVTPSDHVAYLKDLISNRDTIKLAAAAASPLSAQSLAEKLAATGIEAVSGFTVTRAMTCGKARDPEDPSLHCTTFFADAARGGRPAYLEIMVFDRVADFEVRAGKIKATVEAVRGRFAVELEPGVTLSNSKTGTSLKLEDRCYQSRGDINSDAFCLIQVSDRALAFAQVKPAHPSSDRVTTDAGSATYEDIHHASDLATLGAIAVTKASN